MTKSAMDSFGTRRQLDTAEGPATYYSLEALARAGLGDLSRMPFSIKVLVEALLRHEDGRLVTRDDIARLAAYDPAGPGDIEVPFMPARVLMQDFTGVPALVDLAAMRSAMQRLGGDPERINPLIPVDLVIDHSIQVDVFGSPDALAKNSELEFQRNRERYEFLHWGQRAFRNFRVVPPASGICHQVNLEYLAAVVQRRGNDPAVVFPDSLVGTDSHTTMINGLGVVGWGVGGIEAEAVMLGQPLYMLAPEVVGFKLIGQLPEGATATDLVLTVTQMLRKKGVVNKFVEFFGPGLDGMSVPDRATIANMAPEYGATMGFFPVDDRTLEYLRYTGRSAQADLAERYGKTQGLFRTPDTPTPTYKDVLELDLSTVQPSLAGPKRPQDRTSLSDLKQNWRLALSAPPEKQGFGLAEESRQAAAEVTYPEGGRGRLTHGDVVIAAITSCTNTSNPSVMLAAGLLAKKAVQAGLKVKPYVKTSLAPGSKVVSDYLTGSGLMPYLEQLGFAVVGYGCTTCIGNSGPLPDYVETAVKGGKLVAAAVLSGNRNFTGRVHPLAKAAYLASPPLVVAFALAGTVDIDLTREPLGVGRDGRPVFLKDLWPSRRELEEALAHARSPEAFRRAYENVEHANPMWNRIQSPAGAVYRWDPESTYIQEPPFFLELPPQPAPIQPILGARVLVKAGDSVTTDHISPAGNIAPDSPAGKYLQSQGVPPRDFNQYGARRGNDRVMTRGTFANVTFRNQLAPEREGGWTTHQPDGELMTIYDAAQKYQSEGVPTLVLAGNDYGMGSSRDWAAKGTLLLGIKAVLAQSFERIHRSNLVGMGVLPLQFQTGESAATLNLTGREGYDILIDDHLRPRQTVTVQVETPEGARRTFQVVCRLDSAVEVDYYRHGGILPAVLRSLRQG